ncbi:SRPBCC domain-containing protein [Globicatella sanguinis]|uniref:SRPBCC domain-containing protein n=1 Tax=Globicatella sanguinis TaxID=13076 RepID=UPI00254341BB|nr:SRPBCC domain-containing protein [Globicatella sanguinis]WIK66718.1 SRPBCC domain-containing protein [Globicatella sanguinis]WKT56123.1 SRPBCC domain-containing protein [Globicatella sanguinis]
MSNEKELASNQTETSACGYSGHRDEHHHHECNCGHHHDHAHEHQDECNCGHHHDHAHEHHHECSCDHHDHAHEHHHHECSCGHHHDHAHEHHHECGCAHHHDHHHHECGCGHHHDHHHHECGCGHHHDHHHHECGCGHHHDHDHDYEPHHGLTINFDGEVQADINRVWEILTENEYITQWSQGLRIEDYRPGGKLIHTDELETDHSFMILDIEAPVLFTFTWQKGTIAFELKGTSETTTLINFSNWLEIVDENTAISLTNWMINLQTIAALAEGVAIEDRDTQYVEILPKMRQMLSLEDTNTIEFE